MKALKVFSFGAFFLAIALFTYYGISGSYIDEEGWLIEEFWALGTGWIFLFLSLFGFLIMGARQTIRRFR